MRYITQKLKYDCVPTAIFNAIRYFNPNANIKKFNKIKAACKVDENIGTRFDNVCEAVRSFLVVSGEMLSFPALTSVLPNFIDGVGVMAVSHNDNKSNHVFFVERYIPEKRQLVVSGLRPKKRRTHVSIHEVKNCSYVFFIKGINDNHDRLQRNKRSIQARGGTVCSQRT